MPEPPPWLAQELDGLAHGTPTLAHVAAGCDVANKIPIGQRNATLAPTNADGTINLVHYAAWLLKEMGRAD